MHVEAIRQVSDGNSLAKKWQSVAFLLAGFVLFAFALPASAAGNATLSLSASVSSIEVGKTFEVHVLLKQNQEQIDTARIVLNYPATIVEAVRWTPTLLFVNESPFSYLDNTAGQASQGRFNIVAGSTRDGEIGVMTFRAKAGGAARIELASKSHLIHAGEEKIDPVSFTSVLVTVGGSTVEIPVVTTPPTTFTDTVFKFLLGRLPDRTNADDLLVLEYLNGKAVEVTDQAKERAALSRFTQLYMRLPSTGDDWNIIHALAYVIIPLQTGTTTTVPTTPPPTTISGTAATVFQQLTGRLPNGQNADDVLAIAYINGKVVDVTDQEKERAALATFQFTYGRFPSVTKDWSILHALAYAILPAATPFPVFGTPGTVIPEGRNLPLETEAITTFAIIARSLEGVARTPSTETDRRAFFGMVYGYQPDFVDANREAAALRTFVSIFGHEPVRVFAKNIVKVLAYISPFAAQ